MYKLFINNIQIGNYKTLKQMFNTMVNCLSNQTVESLEWKGKECHIEIY